MEGDRKSKFNYLYPKYGLESDLDRIKTTDIAKSQDFIEVQLPHEKETLLSIRQDFIEVLLPHETETL